MTNLVWDLASRTDTGSVRGRNEDAAIATRLGTGSGFLLAVADGVGSRPAGDKASIFVVDGLQRLLLEDQLLDPELALRSAVTSLNRELWRAGQNTNLKGMASTIVAALVVKSLLWVVNVGDSRGYLVRSKVIHRLSVDHSLEEEARQKGGYPVQTSWKHVLTRCVGALPEVRIDVFGPHELQEGDRVVLCSDGLYSVVDELEIADAVTTKRAEDAADELLRLANERRASDNVSIAVLSMTDSESTKSAQAPDSSLCSSADD